jgi:hypothetical protein
MRPGSGSDTQAFVLAEVCQDVVGETLVQFHARLVAALLLPAYPRLRNRIISDYDSKGRT